MPTNNTANQVSVGKPKISGAIYSAPLGTTLPTNATAALNAAFTALGYVSQDGLVHSNSMTRENFRAWGGDIVDSELSEKTDTFKFTLIESLNADVLKFVHGDGNVTGSLASGLAVKGNGIDPGEKCIVVEMVLRGGGAKRIVLPRAILSELGDVTYRDNEIIGYACSMLGAADDDGNTYYEYIVRPAAST